MQENNNEQQSQVTNIKKASEILDEKLSRKELPVQYDDLPTQDQNREFKNSPDPTDSPVKDRKLTNSVSTESTKSNLIESSEEKIKSLEKEIEKFKKFGSDNSKYARAKTQQVQNLLKKAKSFLEDGRLSEDEHNDLVSVFKSDGNVGIEEQPTVNKPVFQKIFEIADGEISNMRKYVDDESLDDKIRSLSMYLYNSPETELNEIEKELEKLQDEPLVLTKKLLALGDQYSSIYNEVKKYGSLKEFVLKTSLERDKYEKNIENFKETISKLEEELLSSSNNTAYQYSRMDNYKDDKKSSKSAPDIVFGS